MADNRITIQAEFGQSYKDLGFVGRVGENDSREIVFDCADALVQFPGASIVCVIKRACDIKPYSAALTEDESSRILPLSAVENAVAGQIMIELRAVSNDTILKSAMFSGRIAESLQGEGDRPGNPVRDVLDRVDSTLQSATETQKKLLSALDGVDTAVDGANTAAENAQTVADTVQAKLDNGDFVGAPGPKGDPGTDASVTADNIQAALGYAPAKVPESASWGIINNVNGEIALDPASNAVINSRSTRQPITVGNLDYAMKAALCDGKGAAWTSAEQKAARKRMGIPGDYELIEEIVLNESVTQVVRTNMSLSEMRIVVEAPVSDSVCAVAIEVYSGSSIIGYGYIGNFINKENIKMAKFAVKRDHGAYVFSMVSTNANSAVQKAGVGTLSESASLFPVENAITKVSLYSTSNAIPLPIGTKITIEGETI